MRLLRFFVPLCWLLGPAVAFAQAIAIDKVLVVVNEEPITLSEYQARHQREVLQKPAEIEPFDGRIVPRIFDLMVNERIQAQTAIRRGIKVSPEEVDATIALVARRNDTSPQQLLEQLDQDGITPGQFRASLREQELIRRLADRLVRSRVAVSEREVETYLASHRELNTSDESYEVSQLFVSLQGKSESEVQSEYENLEHIRRSLLEGRSFEKSAREFSDGSHKDEGGYLGWRKVGQLPQFFVRALRQIGVGNISEILKSDNGLHILKVHDQQGGKIVEQQLIRHILLRPNTELTEHQARQLAVELRARIIAGEDFEKIARAHSADQATGIYGGLLGWANPGEFPPEFEQGLFDLPLNEVSKPLRTRNGYHLVQVLERRQMDIDVDRALKRARQIIYQRKATEFYENWFGVIRDSSHIEYISVNPGS